MLIGKSLLVTPIFENNTNTRYIYLPKGTNWFNLDGKKFVGGNNYQIESNYREIAPIFLRQGSILFLNNVANVTRTHQLSSTFKLVAAMQQAGTPKDLYWEATGEILALRNYDDDQKIDQCAEYGCMHKVTIRTYD